MSSLSANLVILAAIAVAIAPLALAYFRPSLGWPIAAGYVALLLGLIAFRSDWSASNPALAWTAPAASADAMPDRRCREALGLMEQGGILLSRTPSRIVVNAAVWRQLPDEAREVLVDCLRRLRPGGAEAGELEIVEQ